MGHHKNGSERQLLFSLLSLHAIDTGSNRIHKRMIIAVCMLGVHGKPSLFNYASKFISSMLIPFGREN